MIKILRLPLRQVTLENAELAKKNTRLIEESEAMIARMTCEGTSSNATRAAAAAAMKPRRSLFRGLRGCVLALLEIYSLDSHARLP